MCYFVSPVRSRPVEVISAVAQLVEQLAFGFAHIAYRP
jgi:hypothetical protein